VAIQACALFRIASPSRFQFLHETGTVNDLFRYLLIVSLLDCFVPRNDAVCVSVIAKA
jgi:hypothetical protein